MQNETEQWERTVEVLPLRELLERFSEQLLNEPCPWCHSLHPRYAFLEPGQTDLYRWPVSSFLTMLEQAESGRNKLARQVRLEVDAEGTSYLVDPPVLPLPGIRLIDRTVEQPYRCLILLEEAQRAYEEAMQRTNADLVVRMRRVLALLDPARDWQEDDDDLDPREELLACCQVEFVNGKAEQDEDKSEGTEPSSPITYRECGSAAVANTPVALYRLLYLFNPVIDFGDMDNCCLLTVTSPDRRFLVACHFYKYKLALYFYAEAALVRDEQAGQTIQVRSGVPGSDNGLSIQHEEGRLFFQMIETALRSPWLVYSTYEV